MDSRLSTSPERATVKETGDRTHANEGFLREQEKKRTRQAELRASLEPLATQLQGALLEIGCGHGHWLTAYAEQHPEQFCLGFDLIQKRIRKARRKVEKRGLENVCFVKAEAVELLEVLPEGVRFNCVMVLFPDPWPKKRHHRRRLIQSEFLSLLAERVGAGGKLYFRTDDVPYFDWTQDKIDEHPLWEREAKGDWPMEQSTYFQELMSSYHSLSATRKQSR